MTIRPARILRSTVEAGKAALVAALCVTMSSPQVLWAADVPVVPIARQTPLTQQQKALHALNRLTFGPRPGDEQAVSRMGLEKWFDRQLHPESIDDSALEERLQMFPAIRLSQEQLIRRFPSPQMIRQLTRTGAPLPNDPVEHAIYADAMATYNAQQKKLAAGQAAGADPMQSENMMADNAMGMQEGAPAGGAMGQSAGQGMMATAPAKGKGKNRPEAVPMSPEDVNAVLMLPPDQRIAKLVAMQPDEMMSFRAGLRPLQRLMLVRGLSPEQQEIVAAFQGPARVVGSEALEARLLRDVYSERQLQAVMTDFWLNHFSVYARKNGQEPYFLASYERDTILPNALGNFEDLLVATAKSPAMLMYLDNWESIGPDSTAAQRVKRLGRFAPNSKLVQAAPKGLNENYARELMELHTLGVNGGYTQNDVIEVAKCFTGWTIERPYQGGGYTFEPNRHEDGLKTVMGVTIRENGESEGLHVLHMLATSPATAHFISNKLAVRFVSDTPPPALVDRMAQTFLKTGGDIKAVLTTMFHAPEFWSSQVYRAKLKTPIEFMTSALRASDADVANPLPLVQALQQLGMPVYGMQTPNGYSWTAESWANSNALVSRMNFAVVLNSNRVAGTKTDWPRQTASESGSASPAAEQKLETLILGQPAAQHTRETVMAQATNPNVQRDAEQNFARKPADEEDQPGMAMLQRVNGRRGGGTAGAFAGAGMPETPLDTMAGLLMGSPDFQRR